ncbi:MAG: 3-hydroxyacyl-CoA dehydrogenase NAD-binding domain-containing protein, partial [Pirellulales bacterium]
MSKIERVLIVGAGWVGRQVGAKMAASGISVGLVDRTQAVCIDAIEWMKGCSNQDDPLNLKCSNASPTNVEKNTAKNTATAHGTNTVQQVDPATPPTKANTPAWIESVLAFPELVELVNAAPKAKQFSVHHWSRSEHRLEKLEVTSLDQWKPDLVLECVSEQLSLKKRVLRSISQIVPAECIIASNSSYFVPSVLCQFVDRPERFAHFHFHVPVMRETVADIVGCEVTSPDVLESLADLSRRVGQYPLMLRHEHPGYVFNWLLQAVLKAALELVAADVVDPEDVDRSWCS